MSFEVSYFLSLTEKRKESLEKRERKRRWALDLGLGVRHRQYRVGRCKKEPNCRWGAQIKDLCWPKGFCLGFSQIFSRPGRPIATHESCQIRSVLGWDLKKNRTNVFWANEHIPVLRFQRILFYFKKCWKSREWWAIQLNNRI